MDCDAIKVSPRPEATAAAEAACDGGLTDDVRRIWQEMLELAHDHLQLAALETRLAGQSLVAMVAAGVMVALLFVSAWIGILAAVVAAMVSNGLPVSAAILVGVGANLLLALLLCAFIRGRSRYLLWAASLRSLRAASSKTTSQRENQ